MTRRKPVDGRIRHGMAGERLYIAWQGMVRRCTAPSHKHYRRYGGRGIRVCDEWRDSVNFIEWARANGYEAHLTLDRIDNDGDYTPENCRWVPRFVQTRNTCRLRKNNTTGFRGICKVPRKNGDRWVAMIGVDGARINLGCHATARDAAEEYDAFVIGEGLEHTLNFPRGAI